MPWARLGLHVGGGQHGHLVNWARHQQLHGTYALPLLLEAMLMLLFGLVGAITLGWPTPFAVPLTVLLLAYLMGLQNAVVTKMSSAQIRTTHMTGVVTDLGIEMGKTLVLEPQRHRPRALCEGEPRPAAPVCRAGGHVFGGRAGRRCWLQVRGLSFLCCRWRWCCLPCRCPLRGLTAASCGIAAAAPRRPPAGRRQPSGPDAGP